MRDIVEFFAQGIEQMHAELKKGICPFNGQHFSRMARAACEVCTPPRAAPTVTGKPPP